MQAQTDISTSNQPFTLILLLIARGTELSWRALLNAVRDMVVHRNFLWTMHRFAVHIIQHRFGTTNPQSAVNVNRPTGLQVTYTAGPIHAHPSKLASFYRSPSSTRYPRLSEVMKVHVFDIPIPINAEITRRIKVQDVFHLKASFEPNHFRCQVKPNIILNELCYLPIYFASEFLVSHFTWFRCKASKQHSDNRLIY